MPAFSMTASQAKLELSLLNAEAQSVDSSDIFAWLRDAGLPSEASVRLSAFAEECREIGGKVISIGKIVLLKIIEFVKAHSNLAINMAIGAALGALVNLIPLLGPYLAPIAIALGAGVGAVSGHRRDRRERNGSAERNDQVVPLLEDVIDIAREFFKLMAEIFAAVAGELTPPKS